MAEGFKNKSVFVYALIVMIILEVVWQTFLLNGTIHDIFLILIPLYVGYNVRDKDDMFLYVSFLAIFSFIFESWVNWLSYDWTIHFAILFSTIILFIIFGYIGRYLKGIVTRNRN
jgi:hypothetical protein